MKLTTFVIAAGMTALAGAAHAGNRNSDAAQEMVDNIQSNGGNTASRLGPNGDLTVAPSSRGWGNGGSATFGTQVSKSGKPGS